jgi:hypothetical protein
LAEAPVIEPPVLGGTFQHLVEFLKDPDTRAPVLSPKRFSQVMHIDWVFRTIVTGHFGIVTARSGRS